MKRLRYLFTLLLALGLASGGLRVALAEEGGAPEETPGQAGPAQSGEKDPETPVRRHVFSGQDWGERLAEQMPSAVRWLETPEDRFPGLVREQTTASRQGGVLLMAEPGVSPAAGLMDTVQEALADAGWYSLAIPLPPRAPKPLPERVLGSPGAASEKQGGNAGEASEVPAEEVPEKAGAGASKPADKGVAIDLAGSEPALRGEAYDKLALGRIEAGLTHLRERGFRNLALLGVGESAAWAGRYLAVNRSRFGDRGIGLIWVAPRFPDGRVAMMERELGESFAPPLLDLGFDRANGPLAARAALARRLKFKAYETGQVTRADLQVSGGGKRLARRIAGWLRARMAGSELTASGDGAR